MKTLLLSILIACCIIARAEGCNGPTVKLMNYSYTNGGNIGKLYLPLGTNYTVSALGNQSCYYPLKCVRLFRNNQLLIDNDSVCCYSFDIPLGAYEGDYIVEVTINEKGYLSSRAWSYTIVTNPVGFDQFPDINNSISYFVDPTKEKLMVKSSELEISNVQFLNFEGKVIFDFAVNSDQVSFPIGELPAGIYMVKVMRLNQRPAIRKVLIEK